MSKVLGGRYEIIEKIGAGGMAVVYKAKDLLLNRVVTIKVLREQFGANEDFVRRFRREAQSAASLSHPNVVSIYDVGKEDDIEYIVMEYVEGRNLKEIIRDYAPLSTQQAINLARQIGEAISHAHQNHIIHRDIKPQNILVTADGRAKVADFGIAKAVSSVTMTHTSDIVGSVHYLSPEQARGTQTNEQTDIYSLGIILYELLTGKVPYDGESPVAIALKHVQEQAVPPSKLNPRIETSLEAVVMRAIAKSPSQRYATVQELLEDLKRVEGGRAVSRVTEETVEELERTQVHKNLKEEVEAASTPDAKDPSRGKGSRLKPWIIVALTLILVLGAGFGLRNYMVVADTKVPNLVGLTTQEAESALAKAGLKLSPRLAEEFNAEVDQGKIIRQDLTPNTTVKVAREVTVVVSKGQEMLKFPDVEQLMQENAENLIQNSGFTGNISIVRVQDASVPAGTVVNQDPAPDSQWPKNEDIRLFVSSGAGNQTINMPNVIGKSAAQAEQILVSYGLIVHVESEDSGKYPQDVVISTNPGPGESVKQGDIVTIMVSRGPGPVGWRMEPLLKVADLNDNDGNEG